MKLNKVYLNLGGGSILQIANRSSTQMMSYLIQTPDERIIMIDSGYSVEEDGQHLYKVLSEHGKKVDLWIITHAHNDHFGSLLWMMKNLPDFDIDISKLYFSFPPIEWLKKYQNKREYDDTVDFLDQIKLKGTKTAPLQKDLIIKCGGVTVKILNDCKDYKKYHTVNDTTVIFFLEFPNNKVLFLGDLGEEAGKDIIKNYDNNLLKSDIVQMAHHGQNGVNKDFYKAVQPKVCLYTSPKWLWNNDIGGGKNSGPWNTLVTRRWMKELGVCQSYYMGQGDYLFI